MAIPHVPTSADELVAAIEHGLLVESLSFDVKAELESGAKGNRALAIDLAAFAINGGLIATGVAEESRGDAKKLVPRPIPLANLRERVSQVGLSRIDPPLTVITRELRSDDEGNGYLLILVPPSPDAPHMVDGQYRGRGDTTNYVMGDAEVRRIQAQRRTARPDIAQELERAVASDPTPDELRQQAHFFVVARPVVPTGPAMLHERIGRQWSKWIRDMIAGQPHLGKYTPDLPGIDRVLRRPNGWAIASYPITVVRSIDGEERKRRVEHDLLELEIDEDGALRLFCGRGSDIQASDPIAPEATAPFRQRWTFEVLLVGLTWRVLRAAASVSVETGYVGNWDVGVALTNAYGIASHALGQRAFGEANLPFAADDYRAVTQATYAEITENRQPVLERLLGRLNRALNDDVIPLPDYDAA